MALDSRSFQSDPRRRTVVRALSGFYIEGREKPVLEDEIVDVPFSVASGLVHSMKATVYDGPLKPGDRAPNAERDRREQAAAQAKCPHCFQHPSAEQKLADVQAQVADLTRHLADSKAALAAKTAK